MIMKKSLFYLPLLYLFIGTTVAAQGTRLLREPAIHQQVIAFVYAGDIWTAHLDGSAISRITTFPGVESDPHFSPDGQSLAFTAEYDGNTDVYVVPVAGGEPRRLTWHPGPDLVRGWSPQGDAVLFASGRTQVPHPTPSQLWLVSLSGTTPTPLMKPTAANGVYSPDGQQLVYEAVLPWESEFRNYRGGQNTPLRILNLATYAAQKLPWDNSRDLDPVWTGETIYFLSDRDLGMNIWSYHVPTQRLQQVTFFKEFDCKHLAGDQQHLIFENGGYLYTLAYGTSQPQQLNLTVTGDFSWARPHWMSIGDYIESTAISPNGKRLAVAARGEIFTIPAKKGDPRNLSNSQGVADRAVAWSPDGQKISWFSDEGGEYQLVIADQYGEHPKKIAIPNPTFYYHPTWSPDSKYLSFYNENRTLWIVDVSTGKFTEVANEGSAHPEHVIYGEWAPDSKWLAYTKRLTNEYAAIFVYSLEQGQSFQITDGLSDCKSPAWDKGGKYLYFRASTDYGMNVGWLDMSSFDHPIKSSLYLAVLTQDEPSPLAPESDDEEETKKKSDDNAADKKEDDAAEKKVEPVKIDFAGLAQRIIALPVPAGNYLQLAAAQAGTLLFSEQAPGEESLTLHRFTLEKREVEKVVEGISGFEVAAGGEKYGYTTENNQYVISDVSGEPDPAKESLDVAGVKMKIDPPQEWAQIFREAWRYQRDYFYVDNVHGLDLDWAYRTYAPWVADVRHRSDLNYLLDIFSGETSIGHSFVRGGDYPEVDRVPIGLLGADFVVENNQYRIQKIYTGESWNPTTSAPLSGPGLRVKAGDYLLAVNGVPLQPTTNLYAAFDQTADQQTRITVNATPTLQGARELTVVPVASEAGLRQHDWVEGNRRQVDELSGGQLAYVWLPNTGEGGYTNFNRYFFAQKHKKGAVIDERFNQGGSIADYIVDLLARDLMGYFNNPVGDRQPFTAPNAGIWGPKVMIINEMAGSGGDMMPYMFKLREIGPLVGTRTWGGLVGIWDVPGLIDGGRITAPRGGFYNLAGEWDVENIGVAPDVVVEQDPQAVQTGHDPQLEKAVAVALELLKTQSVKLLPQPADPVRVLRPKQ